MSDKIKELCNNKPAAIFGKGVSALCAKGLFDSLGIESVLYSENAADNCPVFDENAAKQAITDIDYEFVKVENA